MVYFSTKVIALDINIFVDLPIRYFARLIIVNGVLTTEIKGFITTEYLYNHSKFAP